MKKLSLILLLHMVFLATHAQKVEWVKTATPHNPASTPFVFKKIIPDDTGNFYAFGTLQATSNYSGSTLTPITSYPGAIFNNSFIMKLDVNGNVLWHKIMAGLYTPQGMPSDIISDITYNTSLNRVVLLAGLNYNFVIDSDTILCSATSTKIIISFDNTGTYIGWGPPTAAIGYAQDKIYYRNNALYLLGAFNIWKFDNNLALQWQITTGTIYDYFTDLNFLSNNDIVAIGTDGTQGAGGLTVDTIVHSTSQPFIRDFYVKVDDATGHAVWVKVLGNATAMSALTQIQTDNNNNLFMAGWLGANSQLFYFGNDTIGYPGMASNTGPAFVLKADATGNPIWGRDFYANTIGLSQDVNQTSLVLDDSANAYIFPRITNGILYKPGQQPYYNQTYPGNTSFIKVNSSGQVQYGKGYNSSGLQGTDGYFSSVVFVNDEMYLAGNWVGTGASQMKLGCHRVSDAAYLIKISKDNEPVPQAQFDMVQSVNTISLHNTSDSTALVNWNFGDGNTSTYNHPVKSYNTPGSYNVCLTLTDSCGSSSLCKTANIIGVSGIENKSGCNNGVSTITIKGAGFNAGSTVKLVQNGFADINATAVYFTSNITLEAFFDLSGQPTGLRNLEVTVPGVGVFTLNNEYEITGSCFDDVSIIYEGVGRYRSGNGYKSSAMRVINNSGLNAVGVPVFWRDRKTITSQILLNGQANLSNIPFFQNALQYLTAHTINDSIMQISIQDDTTDSRLGGIIIPRIDAHTSNLVPLYFINSTLNLNAKSMVPYYPMLYSDANTTGSLAINHNYKFGSFLRFGCERALQLTIDTTLWNPCFTTAYDSLLNVLAANQSNNLYIPFNAALSAMLVKIIQAACVPNLPATLTNAQFKSIIVETMGTMAYTSSEPSFTYRTPQPGLDNPALQRSTSGDDDFCDIYREDFGGLNGDPYSQAFTSVGRAARMCMAGSMDPNEKYGPGDTGNKMWVRSIKNKSYLINFENLSTASAPAQTVIVTDTLDAARFNLATFKWGNVAIGTGVNISLTGESDTTVLKFINLNPAMNNLLRIECTYSPTTGIIKWKFETADINTYQPTTNPLEGFLPPNTNGEGEGSVSFSINYLSSLQNGDNILNHANIVFDDNAPIVTGTWVNAYDTLQPASAVNALPSNSGTQNVNVTWGGNDIHAGIMRYYVFVSENDGAYSLWKFTSTTSENFNGIIGNKYEFYSIAVDNAGNIEDTPVDPDNFPDAVTTITVGVNDLTANFNVALQPNPTSEFTDVHITSVQNGTYTISVTDLQGRVLSEEKIQKNNVTATYRLNTQQFANGTYYINIKNSSGNVVKHLSVLH